MPHHKLNEITTEHRYNGEQYCDKYLQKYVLEAGKSIRWARKQKAGVFVYFNLALQGCTPTFLSGSTGASKLKILVAQRKI